MKSGYCPLCQKTSDYELSGGEYYCVVCGRSKKAAEKDFLINRKFRFSNNSKLIFISIGVIVFAIVVIIVNNNSPDIWFGALARVMPWVIFIAIAALCNGVFGAVKSYMTRRKNEKEKSP